VCKIAMKTDVSTKGAIPPAKHQYFLVVPKRQRQSCSKHFAASELLDLSAQFCWHFTQGQRSIFSPKFGFGSFLQGGTMDGPTDCRQQENCHIYNILSTIPVLSQLNPPRSRPCTTFYNLIAFRAPIRPQIWTTSTPQTLSSS
jgi:hypothetical protein